MDEMWSVIHNAGCRPTVGLRPRKRRWVPHQDIAYRVWLTIFMDSFKVGAY